MSKSKRVPRKTQVKHPGLLESHNIIVKILAPFDQCTRSRIVGSVCILLDLPTILIGLKEEGEG